MPGEPRSWPALLSRRSLLQGVASAAAQTSRESSTISPAQKLVREFDLVPKLLTTSKGQSDGSPLRTIARRMTVIHQDLSQLQTDEPVQTRERQVVRSLDSQLPVKGRRPPRRRQ